MAKKKKAAPSSAAAIAPLVDSAAAALDPSALAEVLSAEHPLIDPSLVFALLSDYDPATLVASVETIRDQLGILEATLVPDAELQAAADDFGALHMDTGDSSERSAGGSVATGEPGDASTERTEVSTEGSESGDELDLLRSLFPAITGRPYRLSTSSSPAFKLTARSTGKLSRVLAEYPLDAAIDHLLSLELIHEVETQGYWPGEAPSHGAEMAGAALGMSRSTSGSSVGSTSAAPLVATAVRAIQAGAAKPAKKAKGEKRTVALVDTLQRGSRPASGSRTPDRPASGLGLGAAADNAWYTLTSLAVYLAELTGAPAAHFLSHLHAPAFRSAHAAVRAALGALPPADIGDDQALRVLHDLYGEALGGRAGDDLAACVNALGGNVGAVLDLMELLDEISLWPGDDDEWAAPGEAGTGSALASPVVPSQALSPALSSKTLSPVVPSGPLPPSLHPMPSVSVAPAQTQATGRAANPSRMQRPPTTLKVAKVRVVPGSQPAPSSAAYPTAVDGPSAPTVVAKRKPAAGARPHHPLNWRTVQHARPVRLRTLHPYASHIPSYARGTLPNDPTPNSLETNVPYKPGLLSAQECWDRAQAERARRDVLARSAGAHYGGAGVSGGRRHAGAVAGHYAAEARAAMERARTWELRAARAVVGAQLERTGATTVDLHHMTVDEAVTLALEAADEWYERQKRAYHAGTADQAARRHGAFAPPVPLTVVTGVGRHSAGHKGVLGPAVAAALEDAGWRVGREAGRGYLVVKGKQ